MAGTNRPGRLWKATLDYFTAGDWPIRVDEGEGIVETAFKGDHGRWMCLAHVVRAPDRLAFYSLSPMDAGAEMIGSLNELLARANFGMVLGNFEIDLDSGSFRYKTSVDASGAAISPSFIESMVAANVLTMDHYLPAVQGLLYAGLSVEDALAVVEG